MRGQSFINFLREEDGKADRQKVLSLSALVGSSILAQFMFVGVTQSHPNHCGFEINCASQVERTQCLNEGCNVSCPNGDQGAGTCYHP